ncbi:MAG: hypothetical protein PHO80_02425 [Candidatus Gracilibacteria bacterium]|nr:hypothetical protein [Candidatus Gracilibacteria bacterium]
MKPKFIILDYYTGLFYRFFDTYLDVYNAFLNKIGIDTEYYRFFIDPDNLDEGINIIKGLTKENFNYFILIKNPRNKDKIIQKLKKYNIRFITFFDCPGTDLVLDDFGFKKLYEYIKDTLDTELKNINIPEKLTAKWIIDNKLIDPRVNSLNSPNFKAKEIYFFPKKFILEKEHCSYKANIKNNKYFSNIVLPDGINKLGCSFCCDKREDPCKDTNIQEQILDLMIKQIQLTKSYDNNFYKFSSSDQGFLYYIDKFCDLIIASNIDNIEIYIQSRVDTININKDKIEQTLKKIKGKNIKLVFYLIGFENFSQETLDIFNKGITTDNITECIEFLDYLEDNYKDNFLASTGSHGFILFTPWTTMNDLRINLAYFEKYKFDRFCTNLHLKKLRLSEEMPLYYKAKKDGVLNQTRKDDYIHNIKYGYKEGLDWQFQDPKVKKVYDYILVYSKVIKDPIEIIKKAIKKVENNFEDNEKLCNRLTK